MRLLVDACVSGVAVAQLSAAGHDVEWAAGWPEDPGDEEILRRAQLSIRVIVTIDKDFGELAIVHGLPHRGIVRLVGFSSARQGIACAEALDRYALELEGSAILTVERGRVRVRPG